MRRIENAKQKPKQRNLEQVIASLELPLNGFILPYNSENLVKINILCDTFTQALDKVDIKLAGNLLAELELHCDDNVILQQFILCKKAKLMILTNKPVDDIFFTVEKGIAITFKKLDEKYIGKVVLILQESELHTIDFSKDSKAYFDRGQAVSGNNLGIILSKLRLESKLTIAEAASGICNKSTLSRIEAGTISGNYFTLEAITQWLGRDIKLLKNFFLLREELVSIKLRDRIYVEIIHHNYDKAAILLDRLEDTETFMRHRVNKQFVATVKALIFANENKITHPSYPQMILNALKITCLNFSVEEIQNYSFTYNESYLLNLYASHFMEIGDYTLSAKIFKSLIKSLDRTYHDEFEKARVYPTLLFNYSTCLGRTGELEEALRVGNLGEDFERSHNRLIDLPEFVYNKAFNMLLCGKKEESLPYFVLTYYAASMFRNYGSSSYLDIIRDLIASEFEIVLN